MPRFNLFLQGILLSLISSPSLIIASPSTISNAVVLNSSAMLEAIHDFMSHNSSKPPLHPAPPPTSSSPSFFSFPIYHIEALTKSHFKDYHSLVLARLRQDKQSASVSDQSELPYTTPVFDEAGIYVALTDIGTPPQRLELAVDTGSSLIWSECLPCSSCPPDEVSVPQMFDPSKSSTYTKMNCEDKLCDSGKYWFVNGCSITEPNICEFEFKYLDNSSTKGFLSFDKISGDSQWGMSSNIGNAIFGCAHQVGGLLATMPTRGILALDQHELSLIGQMKATNFSFCLPTHLQQQGSSISIGFVPTPTPNSIVVPLVPNMISTSYYVGFHGIFISGKQVPIPPSTWEIGPGGDGGVVVDSGAVVTWFINDAYVPFRDMFIEEAKRNSLPYEPGIHVQNLEVCFNMSEKKQYNVPSVDFYFANFPKPLSLKADQILMNIDDQGTTCLAFSLIDDLNASILGNWQFQRTQFSFDLSAKTVVITPDMCT